MAKIMLLPNTATVIKIGARMRHVILLTSMIPTIMAHRTNVVPKSFWSKINIIGTRDMPMILKNKIKSVRKDLLNVNRLWLETILANASIKIIFINSEGWILIGPKAYQLLAPLIIGVIGVSGMINKPSSKIQKTVSYY